MREILVTVGEQHAQLGARLVQSPCGGPCGGPVGQPWMPAQNCNALAAPWRRSGNFADAISVAGQLF